MVGEPPGETQSGRRRPARRLVHVVHVDGNLPLPGPLSGAHAAGDGDDDLIPVAGACRTFEVGYIHEGQLAPSAPGGDLDQGPVAAPGDLVPGDVVPVIRIRSHYGNVPGEVLIHAIGIVKDGRRAVGGDRGLRDVHRHVIGGHALVAAAAHRVGQGDLVVIGVGGGGHRHGLRRIPVVGREGQRGGVHRDIGARRHGHGHRHAGGGLHGQHHRVGVAVVLRQGQFRGIDLHAFLGGDDDQRQVGGPHQLVAVVARREGRQRPEIDSDRRFGSRGAGDRKGLALDTALGDGDARFAAVDLAVGEPQRQDHVKWRAGVRFGPELVRLCRFQ